MEKERRTKALLLSTLVVVVATLSIAFAAMSRTLNINGIGKMDTASWSVYFDNLSNAKITRGAEEVGKPNISTTDNGIIENINVKLSNPKDEISYTVDIVNDGTIDAEITMIKDIELTDIQKKVFEFKVTYTDTGDVLKDGDLLPAGDTKNITITIRFKDDITEFDLPTENQVINLSYQLTYTQYDGGEVVIEPDGGETTEKAILASGTSLYELMEMDDPFSEPFLNSNISRTQIESINFLNSNVVPIEYESTSWDASEAQDGSIMAWYTDDDSNGLNEVYIGGSGGVYAPSDSSALFGLLSELKEINFNGNFDTSKVTDMSGMFMFVISLPSLDLSSFDTSNVTDMSYMISDGENGEMSLVSLNVSSFNTTNVISMSSMFGGCAQLTELDLGSFDTSNVTTMENMFQYCEKIESLNLNNFNTANVNYMYAMFYDCESLTNLDLSSFNTTNVTDMSYMFYGCSSLENLNLNKFNTLNVTTMSSMFYGCESLTNLDLSSFDTTNVTTMENMFRDCNVLTSLDLRNADFTNVSVVSGIFYVENWINNTPVIDFPAQIIVKDETQRAWLINKYNYLEDNLVLPSEL